MQRFIYYVRTETDGITATVVFAPVLGKPGLVHRGISIVGDGENSSKKTGKAIAEGRLSKAMDKAASSNPVDFHSKHESVQRFIYSFPSGGLPGGPLYKSGFEVPASDYEKFIMEHYRAGDI